MRQSGFTLLEIMIVMVLILGMGIALMSWNSDDPMMKAANEVALLIQEGQLRAQQTGRHHRVVVDIEEGLFRIEECEGNPRFGDEYRRNLKSGAWEKAEEPVELKDLLVSKNIPKEFLGGLAPEKASAAANIIAGRGAGTDMMCSQAFNDDDFSLGTRENSGCDPSSLGGATETEINQLADTAGVDKSTIARPLQGVGDSGTGSGGKGPTALCYKLPEGTGVGAVFSAGVDESIREGTVTMHIFPIGSLQRTVIELENDERSEFMHVVTRGLNGTITWNDKVADPEDFVNEDFRGEKRTR